MSVKGALVTLAIMLLSLCSSVSAHATLVLGTFKVTPTQPAAGSKVTLELDLTDPTQVPIEDAYVFVELRPENAPNAKPVRGDFSERSPGIYMAEVTLPQPGSYRIKLRDQTYRQEEASATLESPLRVSGQTIGGHNSAQTFNFPPTATGPASLRSWLLWLIGLPIVAAVVVTVLVLTRSSDAETDAPAGETTNKDKPQHT